MQITGQFRQILALAIVCSIQHSNPAHGASEKNLHHPVLQGGQPKKTDPPPVDAITAATQLGSEQRPIFVKTLPEPISESDAKIKEHEAEAREKDSQEKSRLDTILAYGTGLLAIFTGLLWYATLRLSKDAKASSEDQGKQLLESLRIAAESADAAKTHVQSLAAAERAYVKISHVSPGIPFDVAKSRWVELEIKNWGKTPANVTDVIVEFAALDYGEKLPNPFRFNPAEREDFPNAFLVSGEAFFISKSIRSSTVEDTTKQLWIFGHVDYIDVFGQRWRGGYARKYIDRKGNNLVYNTESRDNFDRLRLPGEGKDWDGES